jgi:hypothetical protein
MTLLSEYLGRPITPEQKDRNNPKVESLDSPMPAKNGLNGYPGAGHIEVDPEPG